MVPSSKEHQVHNPVFTNSSLPFSDQYMDLHFDISIITAELNATLEEILCLDDEDCRSAPVDICRAPAGALQISMGWMGVQAWAVVAAVAVVQGVEGWTTVLGTWRLDQPHTFLSLLQRIAKPQHLQW